MMPICGNCGMAISTIKSHADSECIEEIKRQRDGIQEQLDFMFRREHKLLKGGLDMLQEYEQQTIQLDKALKALRAVMDVLESPLMGIEKLREMRDKVQEQI